MENGIKEKTEQIIKYPTVRTRGFEEVSNKFKKIDTETTLPTRGSKYSAGYDFYSKESVIIEPGKQHVFWTDVKSYMLDGEVLQMHVRSSIGIKKGLVLSNSTGIIDSDYYSNASTDGNVGLALRNLSDSPQTIEFGERIAQGIFVPFMLADDIESDSERSGGIGSTNK